MKILMYGDAVFQTGFARVLHNLADQLQLLGHSIVIAGLNWDGFPLHDYSYPIAGISKPGDPYGKKRFAELLEAEQPDALFMLNDLWVISDVLAYARSVTNWKGLSIGYFPVDAIGYSEKLAKQAGKFDVPITYTQFGINELRRAGYEGRLEVLPHGKSDGFYPLEHSNRPAGMEQDWVVFSNNRNQPRKRLDIVVQGFVKFLQYLRPEDRARCKLFMHCHWGDIGWDLHKLCEAEFAMAGLPMAEHMLATPGFDLRNMMPIEELNELYNFADISINAGLGEGWGLCQSEASQCRKPSIVPGFAATGELYSQGRGFLMQPSAYIYDTNNEHGICLKRGLISADTVAETLWEAFSMPEQAEKVANRAYAYFTRPELDWLQIVLKLEDWLND